MARSCDFCADAGMRVGAWRRRDTPACARGCRHIAMATPQHDERHTAHLGGECQSARRREIECFRLAPWLAEHRAECATAQRIFGCLQHVFDIACDDMNALARIKPEASQARPIRTAFFAIHHILPDPDPVSLAGQAGDESQRES